MDVEVSETDEARDDDGCPRFYPFALRDQGPRDA